MNKATTKTIDREGLKNRIQGAVKALQTAPIDKQRPIFANVIHFAELQPMKVRLGLYAPLLRAGSTTVQLMPGARIRLRRATTDESALTTMNG